MNLPRCPFLSYTTAHLRPEVPSVPVLVREPSFHIYSVSLSPSTHCACLVYVSHSRGYLPRWPVTLGVPLPSISLEVSALGACGSRRTARGPRGP